LNQRAPAARRIRAEQKKARLRIIELHGGPIGIIALFRVALQRDTGKNMGAITHDRTGTLKR
jgi:hypothetical protein